MMVITLSCLLWISVVVAATGKSLRLKYFDARGAAELSRVLLHIGGLPFEEIRYPVKQKPEGGFDTTEFQEAKQRGEFLINMDRVPILEVDGRIIGQSRAIERYVAYQCSLMGECSEEAAVIDCIVENIRDIKDKWSKIRSTGGFGKNPEKDKLVEKWFNGGEFSEWLAKLEKSLPVVSEEKEKSLDTCFAVGNKLSYADVAIWHILRDYFFNEKTEAKMSEKKAACSRLSRIADRVAELPSLKNYLSIRPLTQM